VFRGVRMFAFGKELRVIHEQANELAAVFGGALRSRERLQIDAVSWLRSGLSGRELDDAFAHGSRIA
jgi:hypothetical protein